MPPPPYSHTHSPKPQEALTITLQRVVIQWSVGGQRVKAYRSVRVAPSVYVLVAHHSSINLTDPPTSFSLTNQNLPIKNIGPSLPPFFLLPLFNNGTQSWRHMRGARCLHSAAFRTWWIYFLGLSFCYYVLRMIGITDSPTEEYTRGDVLVSLFYF